MDPEYGYLDLWSATGADDSVFCAYSCGLRADGTVGCWGTEGARAFAGCDKARGALLTALKQKGMTKKDALAVIAPYQNADYGAATAAFGAYQVAGKDQAIRNNPGTGVVDHFGAAVVAAARGAALQLAAGIEGAEREAMNAMVARLRPFVASPPPGAYVHLAGEGFFNCALRGDWFPYCWGEGPENVAPGVQLRSLSFGSYGMCGITPDGRVACWGRNTFGNCSPP